MIFFAITKEGESQCCNSTFRSETIIFSFTKNCEFNLICDFERMPPAYSCGTYIEKNDTIFLKSIDTSSIPIRIDESEIADTNSSYTFVFNTLLFEPENYRLIFNRKDTINLLLYPKLKFPNGDMMFFIKKKIIDSIKFIQLLINPIYSDASVLTSVEYISNSSKSNYFYISSDVRYFKIFKNQFFSLNQNNIRIIRKGKFMYIESTITSLNGVELGSGSGQK